MTDHCNIYAPALTCVKGAGDDPGRARIQRPAFHRRLGQVTGVALFGSDAGLLTDRSQLGNTAWGRSSVDR
jgi:hypothetical protein